LTTDPGETVFLLLFHRTKIRPMVTPSVMSHMMDT
jgi:hypothetical protein